MMDMASTKPPMERPPMKYSSMNPWESEVFWDCFRAHSAARKDKDR